MLDRDQREQSKSLNHEGHEAREGVGPFAWRSVNDQSFSLYATEGTERGVRSHIIDLLRDEKDKQNHFVCHRGIFFPRRTAEAIESQTHDVPWERLQPRCLSHIDNQRVNVAA